MHCEQFGIHTSKFEINTKASDSAITGRLYYYRFVVLVENSKCAKALKKFKASLEKLSIKSSKLLKNI